MKRGRKSTRKKHTQENTTQQERAQEEHGGASMSDVPGLILMDIFSRLSVKSIFRCRCVCKPWLDLLLDPVFAKLHFSRAPTCPLLRDSGERRLSRALYLIELERDDSFICDNVSDKSCTRMTMKLSTIFLLPERESTSRPKYSHHMERRFDIVNSCNGLLCLRGHINKYPIVIYNPVTGEYSVLPKPELDKGLYLITFGLGFCPKTNRYKLVLLVSDRSYRLYTLGGLEGWRIGYAPAPNFECGRRSCPVFINGAIHWLVTDYLTQNYVMSFDFVGEEFRTISLPTEPAFSFEDEILPIEEQMPFSNMSLGVLRGHLYIVCTSWSGSYIDIWEMKDYGVKESWVKEYHFDTLSYERWSRSLYQPAGFLNNGDLLMYHERSKALICIDKHDLKRRFTIGETLSKFQFVAHVPSFVSLKDIMGDTVVVLNVRSRYKSAIPFSKVELCCPNISRVREY